LGFNLKALHRRIVNISRMQDPGSGSTAERKRSRSVNDGDIGVGEGDDGSLLESENGEMTRRIKRPFALNKQSTVGVKKLLSLSQPSAATSLSSSDERDPQPKRQHPSMSRDKPAGQPSDELCVFCAQTTKIQRESIQCDSCLHFYHFRCCGVADDDIDLIRRFASFAGWACRACLGDIRLEVLKLRKEVSALRSETAKCPNDTETIVDATQKSYSSVLVNPNSADNAREDNAIPSDESPGVPSRSHTNVEAVVRRTMRDATRRKNNVIITGLPEHQNDSKHVMELCEFNLNIKLSNVPECRRLGKSVNADGRSRRLLVRLSSETVANDILGAARNLRLSTNKYVADHIYINADLSPIEAKAAFERRKERRSRPAVADQSLDAAGESNGGVGALWGRSNNRERNRASNSNAQRDYTVWNSARIYDRSTRQPSNLVVCGATNDAPYLNHGIEGNSMKVPPQSGSSDSYIDRVIQLDPLASDFRPTDMMVDSETIQVFSDNSTNA
jgi:hypothetical protein